MHTIRLRDPWQSQRDGDTIVWSRKFNWPADLPEGEIVQLVIEPGHSAESLQLNGQQLALDAKGQSDITALIAVHNGLSFECRSSDSPAGEGFPFAVRLEIIPACSKKE